MCAHVCALGESSILVLPIFETSVSQNGSLLNAMTALLPVTAHRGQCLAVIST